MTQQCQSSPPARTLNPNTTPAQHAAQAALISRVLPLADRIRPDSEAAPWVVDAIRQLEYENALMRQALYQATNPPFTGRLDNWQQAAGIARNQRDQAAAHLHTLLNQRLTTAQMQDAERAAREFLDDLGNDTPAT